MERMFSRLIRAVVRGEKDVVSRLLATHPELATAQATDGATRGHATEFFFEEIRHYLVAGDSALHMAAAAFQRPIAGLLMRSGANCRVRNRRGAEPLHYAADANRWDPAAQRDTIAYLLTVGADPNAFDRSGVAPLHRAVRTRSSEAVRALLVGGADVSLKNKIDSTSPRCARYRTQWSWIDSGTKRAVEDHRDSSRSRRSRNRSGCEGVIRSARLFKRPNPHATRTRSGLK
jgi:hypothetical protein